MTASTGEGPLTFLGDVYLSREVPASAVLPDNIVLNLEAPLYASEEPAAGKINLVTNRDAFWTLFAGKLSAVSLANNHILDFGVSAYQRTITDLQERDVAYCGAGTVEENFNNPIFLRWNTGLVGIAGYCCSSTSPASAGRIGVAPIDVRRIRQDLDNMSSEGASVRVIMLHWGAQNMRLPKPADAAIAHQILEDGADIVIGHHSHCIQTIERRGKGAVFYGLGNAAVDDVDVMAFFDDTDHIGRRFTKPNSRKNKESLLVQFDVARRSLDVFKLSFFDRVLAINDVDEGRFSSRVTHYPRLHRIVFAAAFAGQQVLPRIFRLLRGHQRIDLETIRNAKNVLFPNEYK